MGAVNSRANSGFEWGEGRVGEGNVPQSVEFVQLLGCEMRTCFPDFGTFRRLNCFRNPHCNQTYILIDLRLLSLAFQPVRL